MKQKNKKEEQEKINKGSILLSIALIVILGFAVYGNSLGGEFIWDDESFIEKNSYIKGWSAFSTIFTKDIGAGFGRESVFYRPLQTFSYMSDYSLWKLNPTGYHLTNTILHILVALAIFWFTAIILGDGLISLFTSLLFLVHPIHTGAVSYISGRADSLVAFFMILCFIFYLKIKKYQSAHFYIYMILSYILALLSKEFGLILPVLIILYHCSFPAPDGKNKIKPKAFFPLLAIAFVYILLRATVFKISLPHTESPTTIWQRFPGFLVAIANYVKLLTFPFNLHMEYGNKLFPITDLAAIAGLLILVLSIGYIIKLRKIRGVVFFSLSWFFIALLPNANLYPINAYMAEHWLYVSSFGIFLLLAKSLVYFYRKPKYRAMVMAIFVFLLGFYSWLTVKQNNYWSSPLTFYERTLMYAPDSFMTYNNLGNLYKEKGDITKAIQFISKAIEANPNYEKAYYNLGVAYHNSGKYQKAIDAYKGAIEIDGNDAHVYNNLGGAYFALRKDDEAIVSYKKAIALNPGYTNCYYNLATVYVNLSRNEDAMALLRKVIELNPGYVEAYNSLGNIYNSFKDYKQAENLYKQAIEVNPNYIRAYYNIAVVYFSQNKYKLAIDYCDKAIGMGYNVNPDFLKALAPYRE